jgi:hypothetical protein
LRGFEVPGLPQPQGHGAGAEGAAQGQKHRQFQTQFGTPKRLEAEQVVDILYQTSFALVSTGVDRAKTLETAILRICAV